MTKKVSVTWPASVGSGIRRKKLGDFALVRAEPILTEHNVGGADPFGKVWAVRSIIVMVLALAGFLWLVLDSHRRADDLFARERAIPAELIQRAQRGVGGDQEALGYRFFWTPGGELDPVLIAGPIEAGRTGVRWFATLDGTKIYEYDPTVFKAPPAGPNPRPMQKFLSVPAKHRSKSLRPPGWRPLH